MEPIAIRQPAGSRPLSATARRTLGGGKARRLAAALAILLSSAVVARAETAELCEQEMARAARENGIPLNILYSVGLTETGHAGALSPWDMNVDGRAVHSASLDEALQRFAAERARGAKLIDVGCMQINHHWHASHFSSLAEMFDPTHNVDYAAGFLKTLKAQEGNWTLAVARYNAGPDNPQAQKAYVCNVIGNMVASGMGEWTPRARAFCQ
jgi:soluble lytic murein transglycosylase-like protein